jgi:hypothetical protein
MYWVAFFDGSSKVMSDFELDEIIENEDSRDSIVEIKDMDEGIILDTQTMILNRLH